MFGYIKPNIKELKVRELDTYKAYYCGLCKILGKRYNIALKNALSNDCTFLALLLSSVHDLKNDSRKSHCIFHPTRNLMIIKEDDFLNYAADINVLLTYYKFIDNAQDEGSIVAKIGVAGLKNSFKQAKKYRPGVSKHIEQSLKALKELEKNKCDDIDIVSEVFAKLMEGIAAYAPKSEQYDKQLKWLFYNIGKYIYILDALDDIFKDEEKGSYNVFLLKHKGKTAKEISIEISEQVKYNLAMSLNECSKAYELLPIKKNEGILTNIIYDGTVIVMDEIIKRRCIDGSI